MTRALLGAKVLEMLSPHRLHTWPNGRWSLRSLLPLSTLLAIGCGAQAVDDWDQAKPGSPIVPTEKTSGASAPAANSSSGGKVSDSNGASFDRNSLPPCKPGPVFDGSECYFLADGRCYHDQIDACACVCPPNSPDSLCTSGFPSSTGFPPTDVYCN